MSPESRVHESAPAPSWTTSEHTGLYSHMALCWSIVALLAFWAQNAAVMPSETRVADQAITAVTALGVAGEARDLVASVKVTGDAFVDGFASMTAKRQAITKARNVRSVMAPYLNSPDEPTKTTARAFDLAFQGLEAIWLRSIALDERLMKVETRDNLASWASEASQVAADADEAWRIFPVATAALTHSLLDHTRLKGAGVGYLRITTSERAQILASIKTYLPNASKAGDQHAVEFSGRMLREWLMKGWKASDER